MSGFLALAHLLGGAAPGGAAAAGAAGAAGAVGSIPAPSTSMKAADATAAPAAAPSGMAGGIGNAGDAQAKALKPIEYEQQQFVPQMQMQQYQPIQAPMYNNLAQLLQR